MFENRIRSESNELSVAKTPMFVFIELTKELKQIKTNKTYLIKLFWVFKKTHYFRSFYEVFWSFPEKVSSEESCQFFC
jgi:hypothetical protein